MEEAKKTSEAENAGMVGSELNAGLDRESQLLKLAYLALWCMNESHGDHIGDVDGGALQEKATELGILVTREVTEPCCESCRCADYRFPTTCYRAADWVEHFEIQFGLR